MNISINQLSFLFNNLFNNYKGWKSKSKIIVFESDDWGSIRTPDNASLIQLNKVGIKTSDCHYMTNDSLETIKDMESLFDVLIKFVDTNGRHPVFTLNTIMANPDFKKIKDNKFNCYYFESFTDTYKRIRENRLIDLWFSGIEKKVIFPQFHGREHLNFTRWMHDLRNNRIETLIGFEHELFGISSHLVFPKRNSYLAVFDGISENSYLTKTIINEGIDIFNNTFGFVPKTFIPPNYVWNSNVEKFAAERGIIAMQGSKKQFVPNISSNKFNFISNYTGKLSMNGMGYLVRNVIFEPSSNQNKDWVSSALYDINVAFNLNKPAIIDTHRVNYIGSLNEQNRVIGLKKLSDLISRVQKKWPDIEFMNSAELAERIYTSKLHL
jgi:hypothetical protein